MQKPDDIPEDIWEAAVAAEREANEAYRDGIADPFVTVDQLEATGVLVIARAILAERERLTNPDFLAKHMKAIGVVDAEWKTRCEIAEADRADMAETIRRLEARTFGSQLVG